MTRTWTDPLLGRESDWAMYCDELGCGNRSDARPSQEDLPLTEFQNAGWFVAKVFGDICPRCLADGVIPGDRKEWQPRVDAP